MTAPGPEIIYYPRSRDDFAMYAMVVDGDNRVEITHGGWMALYVGGRFESASQLSINQSRKNDGIPAAIGELKRWKNERIR